MKKTIFPLLLLLAAYACNRSEKEATLLPYSIQAGPGEEQARGMVFHDENGNQIPDEGEHGIPGVAVSNGSDLVQTNEKGEYELPVSDDAIIFIIKPKGWMTPLNKENLPRFYYLHKPDGYPETYRYKGVEPTGELPAQVNFPLYEVEESETFRMVAFGDPQPYDIEQIDFLAEDIITELTGRDDLVFGMTMGDLVGDNLDLHPLLAQAVSGAGIPWYNISGNHDVNYMAPGDRLSNESFERVFGPPTYAFEYGDVHFIVIDDVIRDSVPGSRNYVGGLRPDQLTFVSNYLKIVPEEDLVVLTMHIPLAKDDESFRKSDQEKLFHMLKDFPHTLSISAHSHMHENRFFHQGMSNWQQATPHHHFNVGATCGSWWNGMRSETDVPHAMMRDGTPNGYSIINFTGNEYTIDWKVAGSPEEHRMNIHVPRGIVAGSADTTLLTVNFFNGGEQSSLEYRIRDLSSWEPMEKVDKFDPYYLMIDRRWDNIRKLKILEMWEADTSLTGDFPGKVMPEPEICTHLWEASLGTDWPAGRHLIEVRARDRYGRTFNAFQTMRVVSE